MTQTDFNPNNHLLQLKSKAGSQDYLPVQFRLVWFRKECPNGIIETEEVEVDLDRVIEAESFVWNAEKRRSEKIIKQAKGYARFRAVVTDGKGGKATATGSEAAADFADFIEKAETKAIGRALAMLGYGTQFAPEFNEMPRIVDAPVDFSSDEASNDNGHAPTTSQRSETASTTHTPEQRQAKATEQQIASIRKLCTHVKMSEPENLLKMSFLEAKKLLEELTAEYKSQRAESQQTSRPAAAPLPAPKQAKALLDMISKSKDRVHALDMVWDDVKRDALRKTVADADLVPVQVAEINKVITDYEQSTRATVVTK